jgi:hypothetical protein
MSDSFKTQAAPTWRIAGMKLRNELCAGVSGVAHTDISPGRLWAPRERAGFGSGETFERLVSGR